MNPIDDQRFLKLLQREAAASARRRALWRRAGGAAMAVAILLAAVWVAPSRIVPAGPVAPTAVLDRRADLAAYTITDEELRDAFEESGEAYYVVWTNGTPELVSPARPPRARRGPA